MKGASFLTSYQHILIFIAVGLLACASVNTREAKPNFQVYYETHCPDSRNFINNQVVPVKNSALGEYFDVELIPYGKAKTQHVKGKYTFDCQHGREECSGNKLHACALHYLNETSGLDFIHCSMSSGYAPRNFQECSRRLRIQGGADIDKCAHRAEGAKLLAEHGERTHSLEPGLTFIPWITINGVHNREKFRTSLVNFKRVVCEEVHKYGRSPNDCM